MHGYASGPTPAEADVVGKRVGAAIVDSIIGLVLYFVLAGTILGGGLSSGSAVMAMFVLPFAVFVGYYIAFEGLWGSATPGKRLLGIEVVKENGAPIDVEDAVTRNALRFVDGICYYAVGFFFMATSDRKQRLGDRVASTVVVSADSAHGPGARHPHHGRAQQGTTGAGQRSSHSHPNGGQTGHRTQQAGRRGQQTGQPRGSGGQRSGTPPGSGERTNGRQGSRASDGQQRPALQQGRTEQTASEGTGYRPERNSGASS
jgi:uncharacterized RDD family membrane protein YckC